MGGRTRGLGSWATEESAGRAGALAESEGSVISPSRDVAVSKIGTPSKDQIFFGDVLIPRSHDKPSEQALNLYALEHHFRKVLPPQLCPFHRCRSRRELELSKTRPLKSSDSCVPVYK